VFGFLEEVRCGFTNRYRLCRQPVEGVLTDCGGGEFKKGVANPFSIFWLSSRGRVMVGAFSVENTLGFWGGLKSAVHASFVKFGLFVVKNSEELERSMRRLGHWRLQLAAGCHRSLSGKFSQSA